MLCTYVCVQPMSGSLEFSDDLCSVCTKSALRPLHLRSQLPGEESPRKSSTKTFSKRSLRNLDCFGSSSSRNDDVEDVECIRISAVDPHMNTSSSSEQQLVDSEPGDIRLFEFLIRHIIRRNPCFLISNIPFVICQSTDADELTKNRLTRMLICQLKVPE